MCAERRARRRRRRRRRLTPNERPSRTRTTKHTPWRRSRQQKTQPSGLPRRRRRPPRRAVAVLPHAPPSAGRARRAGTVEPARAFFWSTSYRLACFIVIGHAALGAWRTNAFKIDAPCQETLAARVFVCRGVCEGKSAVDGLLITPSDRPECALHGVSLAELPPPPQALTRSQNFCMLLLLLHLPSKAQTV